MISISDYLNPFDAVTEFENLISEYTGAPYVVTTDSCTHAIELCFRYKLKDNFNKTITMPKRTYLSVPMVFHKLNIKYHLNDTDWRFEYNFGFTDVWDSARLLAKNMYMRGQMQCLSFGRTKPLEIGRGGAILLDNKDAYEWLKRASYDGRDLNFTPWESQQTFDVGYHYMMRPEECIIGLNKIKNHEISLTSTHKYPDISAINLPTFN